MDHRQPLAPCLISKGTVSHPRDMLRALETLENLDYRYVVDGELIDEGRAALVKLMADPESATLVVNGCLFLNVSSFRYLDFEQAAEERWRFVLHGDSSMLELLSIPEPEVDGDAEKRPHLLSEETVGDFDALIALDDEDDED
ncbi:MAG: hypothetical protein HGB10_02015 [Coriobacteriia bacterium]|nr:hypothetical protein [Coriobacteriia bacterium]